MKKRLLQLSIFLFLATTTHAYYQAEQGRWLNRDPIGEQGGVNVYGFVINDPLTYVDRLGFEAYRYPLFGQMGDSTGRLATIGIGGSNARTRTRKSWRVKGSLIDGKASWDYSFKANFNEADCVLKYTVRINTDVRTPGSVVSDSRKANWAAAVADQMNKKWRLVSDDASCPCKCVDLEFEAKFTWYKSDQLVNIHTQGYSPLYTANMLNWYYEDENTVKSPYSTVRHEVGHMFGLIDDYRSPLSPPNKKELPDAKSSFMYNNPWEGDFLERHAKDIVFDRDNVNTGNLGCSGYEVTEQ